ncbi:dTDP-4-dehydrorhamnose reductase [Dyella japonica]|uniref:dTDP-4-dehydrorhamnose reductase n=1 Tax=Dyella japonica DSM 16301 TaxID=1440762 RepID=A0A0G9H4F8_9GAMM|nr:dTDP-4-dehydrorhamnose reductase [Dyella japonica]KLD62607.1 dTDP-4-dehydrorhamnose reductase [Dyella japonica DSM 16301]
MKILLLGANGQLGRTFLSHGGLASRGTVVAATRDGKLIEEGVGIAADLSTPETLTNLLDHQRPNVIVNAAAYTAVDRAEQEEATATRINAEAVGALARWARDNDALLVNYSTDYVFAGDASHPYTEDAAVAPAGAYGRSKLAGEQALLASGAHYFNFRTAWVYAPVGQNFMRTMLRLGGERDELRVVADQIGSPTDTVLIVEGSLAAIDRWLSADANARRTLEGTYHLTASGQTSWHGFACAIVQKATQRGLLPKTPVVHAIGSSDFPTPAKRPAYSVLDNSHFVRTFDHPLPDWQAGLDRTLDMLTLVHN